jgi:fatty acid desaturase
MVLLAPGGENVIVGSILLFIGYLIKYRRWTWLISEATSLVAADDETAPLIASLIGNISVVLGGILLVTGVLQALGVVTNLPDWVLLGIIAVATILVAPRLSYNLQSD